MFDVFKTPMLSVIDVEPVEASSALGQLAQAAPSRRMIEAAAAEVFQSLPASREAAFAGLAIQVVDEADYATMSAFGADGPLELLGRLDFAARNGLGGPRLVLYRRPLLDYWVESGAPLAELLEEVIGAELSAAIGAEAV